MVWYNEFNSVFWITVSTLLTGSIGLSVRYCLKSKCDSVKVCWGALEIHRNVELENNDIELNGENRNDLQI